MNIGNCVLCGVGVGIGYLIVRNTCFSPSLETVKKSKKTDSPDETNPVTTLFLKTSYFSLVPENDLIQRTFQILSTFPISTGFIFTSNIVTLAHKIPQIAKDAGRIHSFVVLYKEKLCKEACNNERDIYIRPRESGVSRALQFTQTGRVIVHLNRTKYGDQILGEGSFKKITTAVDLESLKVFASASFKKFDDTEPGILQRLTGTKGLVQVHHSVTYGSEKIRLLLELYDEGDLLNKIQKTTLEDQKQILNDLVTTLSILHQKGYLHRDLKLENIFLNKEYPGGPLRAFIGDLGFTCERTNEKERNIPLGSLIYTSPEYAKALLVREQKDNLEKILISSVTTEARDIWSLGLILSSLLHFFIPKWTANGISKVEVFKMIIDYTEPPEPLEHSPEHLAWRMLRKDPEKRISAEEAKEQLSCIKWSSTPQNY